MRFYKLVGEELHDHGSHTFFAACLTVRLPIEYQLEVVDMNNEDMDMLEWLVRRWIPIPKQYYWENGGNGENLPWKTRAWHNFVGGGSRVIQFIERVGKPVTAATGLTESRFEYVKETMSERQLQKSMEAASQRKLQIQESRRNLKVEEGDGYSGSGGL
jgi:hypothetical protein